ncbi:2-dehydro-3-deoxygluconokinase [Enterococcus sp. DIV0840]|uniref:sugar kinase n=1 Tax=Enterococcus TaxID=1350 RepID=UPI001A8EC11B|nr:MULTISPECIES: sugar kinase [Enterococcus]MBO0435551.1 sugar kinase [Enterococcus sp. DIV0849a]MBO0472155.1 sugar kinase [Enterococcus ureasiticus]
MAKVICLGEIMMRLSTNPGIRLNRTNQLDVYYGGGEANVAVSLANYGHQVQFASKVSDNDFGQAVEKHLNCYGVSTNHLLKGQGRLGTYYVEQGIGQKATSVIYDRKGSAFASMKELEWNVSGLFEEVDLFHISGITPALSKPWQQLTLELVKVAKSKGCKVSFDCNYRQNLWSQKEAGDFLLEILEYVDYCSAGKLDAVHLLGIPEQSAGADIAYYYQQMNRMFPKIESFYSTNRIVHSTSCNELQGTLWIAGKCYTSKNYKIDPIIDRIGGGDAYSGGIIHGLLLENSLQATVEFATAASVLKHMLKGDCNQYTESEVSMFLEQDSAKINR